MQSSYFTNYTPFVLEDICGFPESANGKCHVTRKPCEILKPPLFWTIYPWELAIRGTKTQEIWNIESRDNKIFNFFEYCKVHLSNSWCGAPLVRCGFHHWGPWRGSWNTLCNKTWSRDFNFRRFTHFTCLTIQVSQIQARHDLKALHYAWVPFSLKIIANVWGLKHWVSSSRRKSCSRPEYGVYCC